MSASMEGGGMTPNDIHVTPVNDLRDHIDARDCWCRPRVEDDEIVIHNAMDERETYEQGRPLQ